MGLTQTRETAQKLGAHDGVQPREERNPAAADIPSARKTGELGGHSCRHEQD